MQGTFALGARPGTDWGAVLQPEVDEATEARFRAENANDLISAAGGVPAAAGAPVAEGPILPPPQHLEAKGKVFYILQGDTRREPVRTGVGAHYIRPYRMGANGAVPYPIPEEIGDGDQDALPESVSLEPKPDLKYCRQGRDYVIPDGSYMEVGAERLAAVLGAAEQADLKFARRMEGLANVTPGLYWDCLDPDFNPADRQAVVHQFMSKYLERFYAQVEPGNEPGAQRVADEALHKHRTFCREWVRKHHKGLTPLVTSPAEALTSEFFDRIRAELMPTSRMTREELSRLFMRHPDFASDFATCLYYYTTSLEQSRGGRNATYKQMNAATTSKVWAYKRFGDMLGASRAKLRELLGDFETEQEFCLGANFVDWYDILGQLPEVHKRFEPALKDWLSGGGDRADGGNVPPWAFNR